MKHKAIILKATVVIIAVASCQFSFAQFTSTNFLPYGRYMLINPGPNQRAIGVGKFTNASPPESIFHINSNLITPTGGGFSFTLGEVFRTDCPTNQDTYWRMLRGGNELGSIYSLIPNNDFTIQATQPNSEMRFNTWGANQRMLISQNNNNEPRVGVGTTITAPQTYMHLGEDVLGNSGYRNWMNVGTLSYFGTDNMYVGLRRVSDFEDRFNAVINWGNNPANTNVGDRLLFLFTGAVNNGQASTIDGLETARIVVDRIAPNVVQSFMGIGGDPTVNPYSTAPDPGNTLEINSFATTIGPTNTGLRFTDLNSTAGTIANPGNGVLTVDALGDVIYVPEGGIGNCVTPTTFNGWGGAIDLANTDNFHFLGNGSGAGVNNVIIGATPGCVIPQAKLHVEQSSGANSTTGLLVHNDDLGDPNDWCSSSIGIKSVADNVSLYNRRIAGWFEAPVIDPTDKALALYVPFAGGQVSIGFDCSNISWTGLLLEVASDIVCNGVITPSDSQFKTNVQPIDNPLEKINSLNGYYFEYDTANYPEFHFDGGQQIGFIAQEVDSVVPEVVYVDNESGYYALDYPRMNVLLVEGMKEQQKLIDSLFAIVDVCCGQPLFKTGGNGNGGNDAIIEDAEAHVIDVQLIPPKSIVLDQNAPNPFADETSIAYYIPEEAGEVKIVFYTHSGIVVKEVEITEKGNGKLHVYAPDLSNGIYVYSIIADGEVIDTKKMVRSK